MNPTELAAVEDELREDLEAFARVRRVLASRNGSPSSASRIAEAALASNPDDLDEAPIRSLRGTVEQTVNSSPMTKWTTQKVLFEMQRNGFHFKAEKPIYSVGQALQKLVQKGKIRLVRKGAGSAPNVYRAGTDNESRTG